MGPVEEPPVVSTTSSNSVASATVFVGQSRVPGFVDALQEPRHQPVSNASSPAGIPELTGLDTQAQVGIFFIFTLNNFIDPYLWQIDVLVNRLEVETRIRDGAENFLQVLDRGSPEGKEELQKKVEQELRFAKSKMANINRVLGTVRARASSM